jgi:hypothetical protein
VPPAPPANSHCRRMQAVENLPAAFERFQKIGGVLRFATFDDAKGDEKSALTAISTMLPDVDQAKLKSLGFRRINLRAFYGDWYDADDDALLRLGVFATEDGRELVNPKLGDLDQTAIVSGANTVPEAGTGGQFAYAFSSTPYGLRARPREVQELFCMIRDFVLPPGLEHEISDWSSPRLSEVSDYFAAGMEWWGVFLFTVYVPAPRLLTVVAGSSTD